MTSRAALRRLMLLHALLALVVGACRSSEIRPAFIKEKAAPEGALPGTIVFATQSRTARGLFALEPGREPHERRAEPVTPEDMAARSPAFGPDGMRLAFALDDSRNGGIVVGTVASDERKVVVSGEGLFDAPTWAPDGRRLAYAYNDTRTGSWDLYTVDVDTGARTQLTAGSPQEWHPAWSPDGRYIAFTSDQDGDNAIWLMDVATQAVRKVVDSTGADEQPAWSPDAARVVFTSNRELERWQLFVLDVRTGRDDRLIRSETVDRYPSFSPDGRYVLFSTGYLAVYRADGGRLDGGADRWKLNGRVAYGATWAMAPGGTPAPAG